MATYDELRQRHMADAITQLPAHLERLTWSPDQLAAHRTEQLRQLVGFAQERSPWHAARLDDVDAASITAEAIGDLPVMTKHDLMTAWDEVVTDRSLDLATVERHLDGLTGDAYLADTYHAVASGGSSGRRGVFVYDWDGWTHAYLSLARWTLRAQLANPSQPAGPPVVASLAADRATHMSSAITQTFASGNLVLRRFPVTLPLADIVDQLNALQPDALHGYPTALNQLAAEARAGHLRIAPRHVVCSSEPLTPDVRSALEAAWGAPVANQWASSETGALGVSCGEGPGMHLADDLLIVEVVDERGRAVPPGEVGAKVYVTNLFNRLLPLIRYEISDEVQLLDRPCLCGSGHRLVGDVRGRSDDVFVYAGGPTVHPLVFADLVAVADVFEFQVMQTEDGVEVILGCTGPVDIPEVKAKVEDALVRAGLERPRVTVKTVRSIPRTETGKLRRFVPLATPVGASR